jgi:hypothetical protein
MINSGKHIEDAQERLSEKKGSSLPGFSMNN